MPSVDAMLQIAQALDVEPAMLFLDPAEEYRHRVAIAVFTCPEAMLSAIGKLVDEPRAKSRKAHSPPRRHGA